MIIICEMRKQINKYQKKAALNERTRDENEKKKQQSSTTSTHHTNTKWPKSIEWAIKCSTQCFSATFLCAPNLPLLSLSLLLFLYIGVKYNYIRLYWFLRLFAINGIAVTAAVAAIAVVVAVFSRFYYYYWLCPLFSFAFAPCGLSKNKWIEQWMNSSQQVHVIKLQFVMNHSTATTTSATNQNTPTWTTHRTHGKI